MSYRKNPYKHTHVTTASPGELIVMLYKGAVRFCTEAQQAFEDDDGLTGSNAITRAVNIIGYLQSILDDRHNPDLVAQLDRMYYKWTLGLTKANTLRDVDAVREIVTEIEVLKEAWEEVNSQTGSEAATG